MTNNNKSKNHINDKEIVNLQESFIFDNWNSIKKHIDKKTSKIDFIQRQIWWCSFGKNIGVEEDGKNEMFERPVLIFKRWNKDFFVGIPFTSKVEIKENNERFYYKYNINDKEDGCLILSQIRVLSSKRLIRKVKKMSDYDYQLLKSKIFDLFIK